MRYQFEDCALDTKRRELRRGADLVEVEPQVFDLLEFLIRSRDRVASRDDLLEAVWQGRIVSESTLSSRINAARVAIGDDGTAQRLIRTLPRKGIRFVGEVREELEAAPPAPAIGPLASAVVVPTANCPGIAVLPFDNMSQDRDGDYFADGMTEEIITALARCSGIAVIARNSSFTYKGRSVDVRQIGRELGVGYLLEGSVRRSDERLRITAQLIDATSGAHLWADRFEGSHSEVFELQDRIAENVAGIIEPRMRFAEAERARRNPPQNMTAYDLWLRALSEASEFTRDSLQGAIRTLDQALEIDPGNALAMATAAYYQAQCHFQGWMVAPEATRAKSLKLAWHAVELADDNANVQWMSAFAIWTFAKDAQRARELFRRALAINPSSAIALTMAGWVENANGNPEAGQKMIERALHLNPRHPRGWIMSTGMAISHLAQGKFEDAIRWAEKALVQNRRSAVTLRALAVALVNVGDVDRARLIVQELLQIEPHLTLSGLRARLPFVQDDIMQAYAKSLRAAGLPE